MTELPDHIVLGGAPKDPDLPDYVRAIYTSVKNTWQDAENLDDTHGYTSYIWIPEETFKVDVMKLHVYSEKFRAYSKSALDGGAQTKTSTEETPNHTHDVIIGTKTSVAGGAHSHTVTGATSSSVKPDHTHQVVIGVKTSDGGGATIKTTSVTTGLWEGIYLVDDVSAHDGGYIIDSYVYTNVPLEDHTHTVTLTDHTHTVNVGTPTSEAGGGNHSHTVTGQTAEAVTDHQHNVEIGTPTSEAGGGAHTHNVTVDDHTHPIDFGIYEEAITGRTLSAVLYDPDDNELADLGVILTGEDDVVLDLSSYFETLTYGMYRLVLSASGRLRTRLIFYELCKMYAQG